MSPTEGHGCHLCTLFATLIDPRYEALLVDDIERPVSFTDTLSIESYVGTWIPQIQLLDPPTTRLYTRL